MKNLRVLLVDDNPADVDLIRDTLEQQGTLSYELSVAVDGEDAMARLLGRGKYLGAPAIDLVLLDLNLPRMDGRDVLLAVQGHEALRAVPVVVLTSSDAERDIMQSYKLGANCYVTKPVDLQAFQAIVKAIEGFWLSIAKLP